MTPEEYIIEEWTRYGIAVSIMLLRFGVRLTMTGWRNFDGTDFWCALALVGYTTVTSCNYLLATPQWPSNVGLDAESSMLIPDEEIPAWERGSKLAHASWTIYICELFAFKGVLLTLFCKISTGLPRQKLMVRGVVGFTIVAWLASLLGHLAACTPVEKVWQIKPWAGPYCTGRPQNYWITGTLNILTDVAIMIIPMPMLWKLHLPFQRKAALACLFCSGIFIVICTILRNYYNLGDNTNQFLGQVWAGRECFVCMIVVSAPGIWPLLRKLRVLGTSLYASNTSGNVYKSGSRRWKASAARASMRKSGVPQDFQMLSRSKHRGAGAERLDSRIDEEPIVKEEREGEGEGEGEGQSSQTSSPTLRGIEVTTEYTVRYDEERAEPSTSASAAAAEQWPEDRRN